MPAAGDALEADPDGVELALDVLAASLGDLDPEQEISGAARFHPRTSQDDSTGTTVTIPIFRATIGPIRAMRAPIFGPNTSRPHLFVMCSRDPQ